MKHYLRGSSIDWSYTTLPEQNACKSLDGICSWLGGKAMGGSSAFNDLTFIRGNAEDYNGWAKPGNHVLPYFKKSEDNRDLDVVRKNPSIHSTGGYQTALRLPYDKQFNSVLGAFKELGLKETEPDSEKQIGSFRIQSNVLHGGRQSANGAFIRPIRGRRSNLIIKTKAYATEI